ncbi:phosphatidylglycerophosphatase GEP4 [Entomortierella parvispora]|uniref:Phosphatidylglycerophosphatase GEP4 n=1 Tax=Entomortierella parvispora TaxID=205924 RepID=A0A9P3LX79_9FUNG|nr:phosphatidylglycerophosphatase GEP4 [Entomortierella parvispora]
MVQSFNLQGIVQAFRVLASPRLMVPNLIVRDIRDINFEQLHKAGIIAIAFDKDNCLTRPYGKELYPPFEDAWKRCKDVYKDQIAIVSNSAGTDDDKNYEQANTIEKALHVHVLRHQRKKPAGGEELLQYFSGIRAPRIAFVGDRALTDVVYANSHGMLSILARDVVTEEGDNPMAIRIRRLEHRVLVFLEKMNIKAKPHPIKIDLLSVVNQLPPPPKSKEEAEASKVMAEERLAKLQKEAEASEKEKAKSNPPSNATSKSVASEKK